MSHQNLWISWKKLWNSLSERSPLGNWSRIAESIYEGTDVWQTTYTISWYWKYRYLFYKQASRWLCSWVWRAIYVHPVMFDIILKNNTSVTFNNLIGTDRNELIEVINYLKDHDIAFTTRKSGMDRRDYQRASSLICIS